MRETTLTPCRYCGSEDAKLIEYHESVDGREDKYARIVCECGIEMRLTLMEFYKAQQDFEYTGGYYSSNKKFWEGMHQRLIDKWNNSCEQKVYDPDTIPDMDIVEFAEKILGFKLLDYQKRFLREYSKVSKDVVLVMGKNGPMLLKKTRED